MARVMIVELVGEVSLYTNALHKKIFHRFFWRVGQSTTPLNVFRSTEDSCAD